MTVDNNSEEVVKDAVVDENVDDAPAEDAVENDDDPQGQVESEIETLAKSIGWNPDHKGEDRVDAETYIKNLDAISKSQNIKNRHLENTLRDMGRDVKKTLEFQKKMSQGKIDELRAQLNASKSEAVKEADVEEVKKIDEQLADLETKAAEVDEDNGKNNSLPPEYKAWHEKNSWYDGDTVEEKRLSRYADAIAKEYEDSNLSAQAIFDIIDTEIAGIKGISEKSTTTETVPKVNAVAGTTRKKATKKASISVNELSFEQRKVAEEMVGMGAFKSVQEYADALLTETSGGK